MKKLLRILFITAALFCFSAVSAFADMGSKPRAEIKVINPPEGEYYIDILYQPQKPESVHSNLDNDDMMYNEDMISILTDYSDEGWYTAYCHGTGAPMWGDIRPDEDDRVVFSYFGVPDRFRVIVATADGDVKISEVFQREAMEISLTLDYSDMSADTKPLWMVYIGQFALTCSVTIIVEIIILALFRFRIKENLKLFLFTNVFTQLLFTAGFASAFIYGGTLGSMTAFIPLEIGITILEMYIYRKLLKGHTENRRMIYAIVANIITAALTWLNTDAIMDFMFSLMR